MDLTQLKRSVCGLLQGAPGLAAVDVLSAFPAQRHLPLAGPTLIVSFDALNLTLGALEGFCAEQAGGGNAAITLRLDLFAPGADGHDLYPLHEALCAILMERGSAFGLARLWCQPLSWDEAAGSYRLTSRILLRGRAKGGTPREGAATITDFTLARKDGGRDAK